MSENRMVNFSIIFLALIALTLVLREFQTFLRPLVIAYILTLIIVPFLDKTQKKKSVFWFTIVTMIVVLVGSVALISVNIKGEISKSDEYESNIEKRVSEVESFVSRISIGGQSVDLNSIIDPERTSQILKTAIARGVSILGGVATELFLAIIFLVFLIPSHRQMVKKLHRKLEKNDKAKFKSALVEIEKSIRTYIITKSIVSAGTALASMLMLWLFGSDLIFILGILFFVLNFIPNIGSIAAVIIALFLFFISFGISIKLVILAILLTGVQLFFGNYIEPKVAGKQLNLSPVIILLSLFIWYWIWGLIGMMLAVPLTSIVRIVLARIESTKGIAAYFS